MKKMKKKKKKKEKTNKRNAANITYSYYFTASLSNFSNRFNFLQFLRSRSKMGKQPVCVLVTEAAGEIGDALVHKIAGGMMLGPDQPMILHMHYNPGFAKEMNGVKMDLVDSAFPLVKGVVATTDVVEACTGVNIAIMVKGEQGMESKAVMAKNDLIYESLASALEQHAACNCKVLIVANPVETIALALKDFAPSIPKENVTCLTRLDHNRALGLISERLNVPVSDVKNVIVWGYDPFNCYLDVSYATVKTASGEKHVHELVADDAWLHGELIATVQQRGAAIIKAGKKSCALSVAKSACDHIHDWVLGTPKDTWVPMGVYSDGSYNVPAGLIHSFPVTCRNGKWEIVQDICNYKPTHHHQEEQWTANSDSYCTICLSNGGELERGKINCCEHYFHLGCIMKWSERESLCPICKGRFSTVESVCNDANQGFVNVIVNVPIRDQGRRLSLDTNQGNANVIVDVPVRDQGNTATQQPTDGLDIRDRPPNTTPIPRRRYRSASGPFASSSFH